MKGSILLVVSLALVTVVAAQDVPGGRDHPLLTRMPGFHIDDHEERGFDAFEFRAADGKVLRAEGRLVYIDYGLDNGAEAPSELQIVRNHTRAIEAIGGTILFSDGATADMRVEREGKRIWIRVRAYNQATAYSLHIVEEEAMRQEVTADADAILSDLAQAGRSVVYGIYFDFDKAEVKPESEPTLREIARLLRENSGLRLHVVGHTDNVGELDYNLRLSERRAAAVVNALMGRFGVTEDRLRPAGLGPLAPAASNRSEEGRARNRRVELVEQ